MYVCLCRGVTDKQIRESTGCATQCGKCACRAKQGVKETLGELHGAQQLAYVLDVPRA